MKSSAWNAASVGVGVICCMGGAREIVKLVGVGKGFTQFFSVAVTALLLFLTLPQSRSLPKSLRFPCAVGYREIEL